MANPMERDSSAKLTDFVTLGSFITESQMDSDKNKETRI
jgi:hypothetical protein